MPALLPWLAALAPVAGDILGIAFGQKGAKDQNKANREQAERQMQFQREMATSAESFSERMANTAMQRRVKDLLAAGLNPALAYENAAAAPTGVTAGGASARMENTVSSAWQVMQLREQIASMRTQRENETRLATATVNEKEAATQAALAAAESTRQTMGFNAINQPHITRQLELQNLFSELGITGAENDAELEKKLQAWTKGGGGSARTLIQVIRSIFRAR